MQPTIPPTDHHTTEAQLRARIVDLEQRLLAYEHAAAPAAASAQMVLDTIPVPIFVKDIEGVYQSCNHAFERYLGRERRAIIGHTAYDIAPAHLAERYHQADMELIRQGATQAYEASVVPADGPPRTVRFHKAAVRAPDGTVAGLVGIILDITEERRLEQELRERQELVSQFLEALPIGVFVIDAAHQPFYSNRIAREIFAAPTGAGRPQNDQLRVAGTEQPYPLERLPLASALRGEPAVVDNVEVVTDKGRVPIRAHGVPVYDAAGAVSFALVALADISAERRAEAALREHEQQARVIQAQAEALRELSTPLLAISAGVVVMPLVGAVDSQRAQQIGAALLEGVSAHRARVAIIDITGVPMVDTQVANALVQVARSARLLGAQVVLTGIRPEVAQILVNLGVSLDGLVTQGELRSGIAFALSRR